MPRRSGVPKRDVLPDPKYNNKIITKLINQIMLDGKQGVAQKIHAAEKHNDNPVLRPEKHWENTVICGGTVRKEADRYRMWYQSRGRPKFLNTYAESEDGIHWKKPILKLYKDIENCEIAQFSKQYK